MLFFGFGLCSQDACNATTDTHKFDTINADSVFSDSTYSKAAKACLDGVPRVSSKTCDDVAAQLTKELSGSSGSNCKENVDPRQTKERSVDAREHANVGADVGERRCHEEEPQVAQAWKSPGVSNPFDPSNEEAPQVVDGNMAQNRIIAARKAAQRAKEKAEFEEQFKAWQARQDQVETEQKCPPNSQDELHLVEEKNKRESASCATQETIIMKGSNKSDRSAEEAKKKLQVDDFLLAHGFPGINSKRMGKFGRFKYPLHTAVKRDPEMLPLLLEAGADPSRKNSAGLTPLQYAQKLGSGDAERLLCDRPTFHRGMKHHSR